MNKKNSNKSKNFDANHFCEICDNLHKMRKLFAWTQDKLAKEIGVGKITICHMETSMDKDRFVSKKMMVIALYIVLSHELKRRKDIVQSTDFNILDDKEIKEKLKEIGLSKRNIIEITSNKIITAENIKKYLSNFILNIEKEICILFKITDLMDVYQFMHNINNSRKEVK